MRDFLSQIPDDACLDNLKFDWDTLYYFEAERLLSMRQALLDSGFKSDTAFRVLDFGYLHGLVPEFLHRFFPRSTFTVYDHPESPNFKQPNYLALIKSRAYVSVDPCRLETVSEKTGKFDLIILGEIIEHLDPTVTAKAFCDLRKLIVPSGCLLITTPNRCCIRDNVLTLLGGGHATHYPPIPDETMGYPHIHNWSHPELKQTLQHFGWQEEKVYYNHGKGAAIYALSNREWTTLKNQFLTKAFYWSAQFIPRWRDFMVSTWKPK